MKETGWIQNAWGIKYLGGGTCHFWIANRMILATAAFQGMPYPIGSVCGRDIAFAPAVPANVTETAPLYPNSDPSMAQTATWRATAPAYAGYIPSGFLLPRGTNDNRAIAAGSEKLTASTGQKGRVFLVGPRPGMTYSVGTTFEAALQIDPIVPVNIIFKLFYPDGRTDQTSGFSDAFGSFSGTVKFLLDVPGIY